MTPDQQQAEVSSILAALDQVRSTLQDQLAQTLALAARCLALQHQEETTS